MRLGSILPHIGTAASPEAIIGVARRAEARGYESLWVTDRTMFPANPCESYAGGPLPEPYRISIDRLQTLAFAAVHTTTIRLGTSILVMGYYTKSSIEPKPAQDPHPPIYMAAYAPASAKRVATYADGWNPGGYVDPQMWASIREMASAAGRDPDELRIVVRANINITDTPVDDPNRWPFNGSQDQAKADLEAVRQSGADEIFFDPSFSPAGAREETFLETLEMMWSLANS